MQTIWATQLRAQEGFGLWRLHQIRMSLTFNCEKPRRKFHVVHDCRKTRNTAASSNELTTVIFEERTAVERTAVERTTIERTTVVRVPRRARRRRPDDRSRAGLLRVVERECAAAERVKEARAAVERAAVKRTAIEHTAVERCSTTVELTAVERKHHRRACRRRASCLRACREAHVRCFAAQKLPSRR